MAGIAIGTAFIVFILGFFIHDFKLEEISLVTIATLVSSIPEGLPAVLSIVLAIGANRMSKKNAIIRQFTATEMAGSLSVILTDKTGTITQGVLTVKKLFLGNNEEYDVEGDGYELKGSIRKNGSEAKINESKALQKAAFISSYCNNASIEQKEEDKEPSVSGDPTEVALLTMAKKAMFKNNNVEPNIKRIDDLPFNSEQKFRASLVDLGESKKEMFVVGAPEKLLSLSSKIFDEDGISELDKHKKKKINEQIDTYTNNAMRVVACAFKPLNDNKKEISQEDVDNLVFSGIFGIIDPPRKETEIAVDKCKRAGIRVVMVTGDHKQTALAIAKQVGITDQGIEDADFPQVLTEQELDAEDEKFSKYVDNVNVFARMSPQTKLKIAEYLQEQELMLAMTGDGVNDAPALKKADVGIAMGQRGTDVAKDVSQIVLSDDNFASIVEAIQEGRIVFKNVRQTSFFLITTNFASTSTLIPT